MPLLLVFIISGCGGIGRHARFRFWWATVQVQVLSPALRKGVSGSCPRPLFSVWVETLNLSSRSSSFHYGPPRTTVHRTVWAASLRSALNGCPPDIQRSRLRLGRSRTTVHRISWVFVSLRSVQSKCPLDILHPCHPH